MAIKRFMVWAISIALCLIGVRSASAATLVVRPDGTGDFATVQEAVDAAQPDDVVELAEGVFEAGGRACDGQATRVVIGKRITLRGQGRDKTVLRGKLTAGGSYGAGCVRCLAFDCTGAVVERLTLSEGGTENVATGLGGGVYTTESARDNFVVDCTIEKCAAYSAGAAFGRAETSVSLVRTKVSDISVADGTKGVVLYDVPAYHSLFLRTYDDAKVHFRGTKPLVNCTIADSFCSMFFADTLSVVNSLVMQYSYRLANSDKRVSFLNVFTCTGTTAYTNETLCANLRLNGSSRQFIAPLFDDYRLLPTSDVVSFGEGACLDVIPAAYRLTDFNGKPFAVSASGKVAAGCCQETVEPAGRAVVVKYLSGLGAADRLVVDGRLHVMKSVDQYAYPTGWPAFLSFDPQYASQVLFGYTASGADSVARFPVLSGAYHVMFPPLSASEDLTLTPRAAEVKTVGVDKNYATIQDAVDAVAANAYAIIEVAKGTYATGGGKLTDADIKSRVSVAGKFIRLVATDGPEQTFIVGEPDAGAAEADQGCGAEAVRCVAAGSLCAIQGFTLTGGRTSNGDASDVANGGGAAYSKSDLHLLDCIVSNNVAGLYGTCYGNTSIGGSVTALRTRFVDNVSLKNNVWGRGVFAASCLWANNRTIPETTNRDTGVLDGGYVVDSTLYAEADATGAQGYLPSWGNTPLFRNSIALGFTAYRNATAYGMVVDKTIPGSAKPTYVTSLTGDYVEGSGIARFLNAVKGDFRVTAASAAKDFAFYDGTLDATAYRYATASLDGVLPDFSKSGGKFTAGAYRKCVPFLVTTGMTPTYSEGDQIPAPVGATFDLVADTTRPLLDFAVNGVAQGVSGKTFHFVVSSEYEGTVNVTRITDNNWYVDAAQGDDNNLGTRNSPKETLAEGLRQAIAGDVVHVAEGMYTNKTMLQTAAVFSGTPVVRARAWVPEGVSLVGAGAGKSFIVGEPDSKTDSGFGENAIRCVVLGKSASLRGFTLTGGRTKDVGTDENSVGGGVLAYYKSSYASAVPVIEDCMISNCAARCGGGAFCGRFNRCRFLDDTVVTDGNGPALRGAGTGSVSLSNSIVDRCVGWAVAYMVNEIASCTFGPGNGASTIENCYDLRNTLFLGANSGINAGADTEVVLVNCAYGPALKQKLDNVTKFTVTRTVCQEAASDGGLAVAEGTYEPVIDACLAVDNGNKATAYDAATLGEQDVYGNPRFVNGLKLDIGAVEADWCAAYAKKLGRRTTVLAADPSVERVDGGVMLPPAATLSLTVSAPREASGSFELNVSGGSVGIAKDGSAWKTVAESGRQEVALGVTPVALDFGTDATATAVLSSFKTNLGMALIFR